MIARGRTRRSVHDDLATRDTRIRRRAAKHERARRVHERADTRMGPSPEGARKDGLLDELPDGGLIDSRGVLCRDRLVLTIVLVLGLSDATSLLTLGEV